MKTRGRTLGSGRVNKAVVEATTEEDTRRHMIEDGLDPDNPLAGMQRIVRPAEVRKRTGLSQAAFAKALRIPAATLENWEQGRTKPDPVVLSFFALVVDDPERAFRVLSGSA